MYKIIPDANGKSYKTLAKCRLCEKRYVVPPDSKYHTRFYCPECYIRAYGNKEKN